MHRWGLASLALLAVNHSTTGASVSNSTEPIIVAIITAFSGLLAVIIGPFLTEWMRTRYRDKSHDIATSPSQTDVIVRLLNQLEQTNADNHKLQSELDRLRKRHD